MKKNNFKFLSADGRTNIHGIIWRPEGEPVAVLQIAHGMCEFVDRYDEFARFLCEKGFVVVGNDHLGHGESIVTKDDWGFFAVGNGRECVLNDMHTVTKWTKEQYPKLPYFLLGHSMGSFFARQYFCEFGKELTGIIIMGTGNQGGALVTAALTVTKVISMFKGWRYRSTFVNQLVFGNSDSHIEENQNPEISSSWLTKDVEIAKKFEENEACRFIFTLNGFYQMFRGIYKLTKTSYLQRMPKDKPVLFVAGEEDPVGNYGVGVKAVAEKFKQLGVLDVKCRLYPGDRHEILNELDRDMVYGEIYDWLISKMNG